MFLIFLVLSTCSMQLIGQSKQMLPIDKKATNKTKALYSNLKTLTSDHVLFGHQDDLAYGVDWKSEPGRSDVKDASGSYPALYGWELANLGDTMNLDSVNFKKMVGWIKDGYKRGGVITVSWHMDNPVTGGDAWDTTPAVSEILPGGSRHQYFKKRLDLFADFVGKLKVGLWTKIPIIFRPYHEHTGSWFWWGKDLCSVDEYKELWRFTVNYLTNDKKLHNILYAYSTDVFDTPEQYLERYPGDDFIDILGFDDYHSITKIEDSTVLINRFRTIVQLADEKNKIAALTETGIESVNIDNWWTDYLLAAMKADPIGRKISYAMVWRNASKKHHYAPYKGHQSVENFRAFKKDEFTLFEEDLPKMYKKVKKK